MEKTTHAVAILAAVFWAFNAYIHATVYEMGLETPIAVFSVVLVLYSLSNFEKEWRTKEIPLKQFAWLVLIAALAMFSRLDLVFFAVIIGIWLVFRGTSMRYFVPLDIAIIFISMTSAVLLRTGFESYNTTYASSAIEATFIALVIKLIALYFFGAYQHPRALPVWIMLRQVFFAVVVGWYLSWVVVGILIILWFYYTILFRRASVIVGPNTLRLQGPIWHMDISYGRIYTVTAGHMEQHYSYKLLSWHKKSLLRPVWSVWCACRTKNPAQELPLASSLVSPLPVQHAGGWVIAECGGMAGCEQ